MRIAMISLYVIGVALIGFALYRAFYLNGGRWIAIPFVLGIFCVLWGRNIHKQDDAGQF